MDVAVVFESMFGNTQAVAEAIAAGVREVDPTARVTVLDVAEASADRIAGAALVVGAPTHVRGLSRATSRRQALAATRDGQAPGTAEQLGIREWLAVLPRSGRPAAAFDTRLASPFAGGAARSIAKSLRRHGFAVVAVPEGFLVEGAQGPLCAGECDRAKAWGASLANLVAI